MKSFAEKALPALPLTHDLLRSVGTLHEYRGREQLYTQQARQALDTLTEVAVIRSTEIGGISMVLPTWPKLPGIAD